MDIRAEFEGWYDKETNRNDGVAYYADITGKYCFADIEFAWQAYKAATEAARGGDVEPVMYVNEGQIKAARKMRSRGKDVGYVAFSLPNEGFNPVPLYTHPSPPVVPEGLKDIINRVVPRIDAGGPNPLDEEKHHCEHTLYRERERIHGEIDEIIAFRCGRVTNG